MSGGGREEKDRGGKTRKVKGGKAGLRGLISLQGSDNFLFRLSEFSIYFSSAGFSLNGKFCSKSKPCVNI